MKNSSARPAGGHEDHRVEAAPAGPTKRRRAESAQYRAISAPSSSIVHSTSSLGGSAKTTLITSTQRMATALMAPPKRPRLHGAVARVAYSPLLRRRFRQFSHIGIT